MLHFRYCRKVTGKLEFVKVEHLNVPYDYEFDLISDNSSTDREKVVREIKRKKPC